MKIKMYQVDAFTARLYGGNPAAVCVLESWLTEKQMQDIAGENNLAETAFVLTDDEGYHIRWFTPRIEVPLCGHATLAAAHIIFNHLNDRSPELLFHTLYSGVLSVKKNNGMLTLNFPTDTYSKVPTPIALSEGLGIEPMETYRGKTAYMAVLPSATHVLNLKPDFDLLGLVDAKGVIVTAIGEESTDFVSRFFSLQAGVVEDPVTGSAHTTLIPYWAKELGRNELVAVQLSERRGQLWCTYRGERVHISGYAVTYMEGTIEIE